MDVQADNFHPQAINPSIYEHQADRLNNLQQETQYRRRSTWSCGNQNSHSFRIDLRDKDKSITQGLNSYETKDLNSNQNGYEQNCNAINLNLHRQPKAYSFQKPFLKSSRSWYQQNKQIQKNIILLNETQQQNKQKRKKIQCMKKILKLFEQANSKLAQKQPNQQTGTQTQGGKDLRVIAYIEESSCQELTNSTNHLDSLQKQVLQTNIYHSEMGKQLSVLMQLDHQRQQILLCQQSIVQKRQQIQQLKDKKMQIQQVIKTKILDFLKQIQYQNGQVLELQKKYEQIQINLNKWKQKRFQIRQKYCKQQRLNKDIDMEIDQANVEIQKSIRLQEKLRNQNIKFMLKCSHQYYNQLGAQHDENQRNILAKSASVQNLNKIKKNRQELKMLISKQKKQKQIKQMSMRQMVSQQTIEQKQVKIKRLKNTINQYRQKKIQQKQKIDKIQELKIMLQQIKCKQKQKRQRQVINSKINELASKQKQLSQKLQKMKCQNSNLKTQCQRLRSALPVQGKSTTVQNITVNQQQKHKNKIENNGIQNNQKHQSKKMQIRMKDMDESGWRNKQRLNSHRQIKENKKEKNRNCFFVKKQTKWVQFYVIIFVLLGLVAAACFQNKVKSILHNFCTR